MATVTETKVETPPAIPLQPAAQQSRQVRVVEDDGALAYLMDTARFEHLYRIAQAMSRAALIPDHLRGVKKGGAFLPYTPDEVVGNCFLVVNQSVRWGIDPFAAMAETYAIGGKLAYQGKLVAAVVNARAGLLHNLRYEYTGTGNDRTITVFGQLENEVDERSISLSVGQARTSNEMWTKDPDQKLVYSGATKWARRHTPEILLGVLTDDDLERIENQRIVAATSNGNGINRLASLTGLTKSLASEPAFVATEVQKSPPEEAVIQLDDSQEQSGEEIQLDVESALEPYHDLLDAFGKALDRASVAKSVQDVNKARATYKAMRDPTVAAGEPDEPLPQIVLDRIDKMADFEAEQIKSKRGPGSNKTQKELG